MVVGSYSTISRFAGTDTALQGADVSHVGTVTHPKPSIVGVVASMDQSLGKFHATVRAQELVEPSDGATVMRPRRQEVRAGWSFLDMLSN